MSPLHQKLARDLWRMRAQVLTVALTAACGVATWVASLCTWRSLQTARDRTYQDYRFGDVFAHVQRAPDRILGTLAALPGVAEVEGRISEEHRVEVAGFAEPVRARFLSLPPYARLDRLFLRQGALPVRDDEVVINELFAEAHHLSPGDTVHALLSGRRAPLRVSGIGGAPDNLWIVGEGGSYGDPKRLAVFWMRHDALADATGMRGAFNDVALSLAPGASPRAVVDEVDRALAPWGSSGAYDRSRHISSRLVDQEIGQLRGTATILPTAFLAVSAFLVNVLLSRLVALQREQLAMLKAFGYPNRILATHYLGFALALVIPGALVGLGLGSWVGSLFLGLYQGYFRFPELSLRVEPAVLGSGALIAVAAAGAGALGTVRRVIRLAPAEAMRPEAPAALRRRLWDRLRLHDALPIAARMVARELERRPLRALVSSLGIAAATAILVAGTGAFDSMAALFETEFEQVEREDLSAGFVTPLPAGALDTVRGLPGVVRVEPRRVVPARLRAGAHSREVSLIALYGRSSLRRVVDDRGVPLRPPSRGLVLSRVLAELLAVRPGDAVDVELLESNRGRRDVRFAAVIDDTFGLNAYLDARELQETFGEPELVSEALVRADRLRLDAVEDRLERMPQVVGITRPEVARDLFRKQTAEVFSTYQAVMIAFATVIAVGVVYNNARIAFVTRSRDLASLRILGFTRDEVGSILLGEQVVQLVIGIPLGFPLGRLLLGLAFSSADRELYRMTPTVLPGSYAIAALVVLAAGLSSGALVRRGLRRLDLVAVLKARD